jgi:hypothetical protein
MVTMPPARSGAVLLAGPAPIPWRRDPANEFAATKGTKSPFGDFRPTQVGFVLRRCHADAVRHQLLIPGANSCNGEH